MNDSMRKFRSLAISLVRDEEGAEVIEWVVLGGLVLVATIVTISNFGTKVLARWTSINTSM